MVNRYARDTDVSVDRSRAELERTLQRYGATGFGYAWKGDKAVVAFELANRQMRFTLPVPPPDDRAFTHTEKGQRRAPDAAAKERDKEIRRRWRALNLVVKAKLEAVASGITNLEDEFLAFTVLPDGTTVGEFVKPQLAIVHERNTMPPLLPMLSDGGDQ